jgi:hypothetical protein
MTLGSGGGPVIAIGAAAASKSTPRYRQAVPKVEITAAPDAALKFTTGAIRTGMRAASFALCGTAAA